MVGKEHANSGDTILNYELSLGLDPNFYIGEYGMSSQAQQRLEKNISCRRFPRWVLW
jgi:hypothetical protein